MEPLLTVVMSCYDQADTVAQAIESVLMQKTDFPVRLIITDDHSTKDDSVAIIREYAAKYPDRIAALLNEENGRYLKNVLRAMAQVKSEYFTLLDADDYWTDPDYLADAVAYLKSHGDFSVYFRNVAWDDGVGGRGAQHTDSEPDFDMTFDDFVAGRMVFPQTTGAVFRNVVYGRGIPPKIVAAVGTVHERPYDGDVFRFLLHLREGRAHFENKVSGVYRVAPAGVFAGMPPAKRDMIQAQCFVDYYDYFGTARGFFATCARRSSARAEAMADEAVRADPVYRACAESVNRFCRAVKVSVIMPVYNGEKDLRECLDSVLGQDLREIEVICCDDGSTDRTKDIIRRIAAEDPRVRLIELDHGGSGPARNAGLDAAVGKYVVFMDGDDKYPDASTLRTLYEAAESSGCPIAGGNTQMFSADPSAQIVSYGPGVSGFKGVTRFSDYQIPYGFTCYVYDRELLDSRKIRFLPLLRYQDPGFFVRAMVAAERFYALNRTTYLYRVAHKTIDWAADGYRKQRAHFSGLEDMLDLSARHRLPRLAGWVGRDLETMTGSAACIAALSDQIHVLIGKLKVSGALGRSQWKSLLRGFASQEDDATRFALRRRYFGRLFLLRLKLFCWRG